MVVVVTTLLPIRELTSSFRLKYEKDRGVNVAIEIPDDIGRTLCARGGDLSRAVLQAVAVEAYRSGTITPAQVQQMLGLRSRWETEAVLRDAEAYTATRWMIWNGILQQFAMYPGNDCRLGYVTHLLSDSDR